MHTMLRFAPAVLLLAFSVQAAERTPDDFFQSFTDEWMRFNTDNAAALRYFTGAEQDAMERQIAPVTDARRAARMRLVRKGLQGLASFDRAKMTDRQRLSADIIAWDLNNQLEGDRFREFAFPLVQNYGRQATLVNIFTVSHPLATPRDAENYVARLAHAAPRMEEGIAEARRLMAKKMIPPRFIFDATLREMRGFVDIPAAHSPFVAGFDERMAQIHDLTPAHREELRAQAERLVVNQVYPVWRKAMALLESGLPQATSDAGLWRLPNGVEAYAHALRQYTTTTMTADEIHQTGLRMVKEIEDRMDALLRQQGRAQGTVTERQAQLAGEQPVFPDTEEGRAAYVADIERTMRDAEQRSASLFDRVPKGAVTARPYPAFFGQRAASYSTGAPDGSRPGVFQFTMRGGQRRFSHSTIYHETVPGHHFQGALQMEDESLPRFLRQRIFGNNSAIGEGWGLYAERLAAESGWYEGDAWGALDQLAQALFRARRLVVDTGLHAKHWTRQQAIDYGIAPDEVDRYVVQPGQACSYMIGELKIVALREKSRDELGPKFSLKEFHSFVLGTGRVPLDILEQQVNRYIQGKKAG